MGISGLTFHAWVFSNNCWQYGNFWRFANSKSFLGSYEFPAHGRQLLVLQLWTNLQSLKTMDSNGNIQQVAKRQVALSHSLLFRTTPSAFQKCLKSYQSTLLLHPCSNQKCVLSSPTSRRSWHWRDYYCYWCHLHWATDLQPLIELVGHQMDLVSIPCLHSSHGSIAACSP